MKPAVARALALGLLGLLACSEPTQGPVRIVWGRHACDHCGMAINEKRFAAEVRIGPHEVARFDDFGCAVAWLEAKGGLGAAREFWVMDQDREEWLDARGASYRRGQRTPMAFGLGAVGAPGPETIDFEAARQGVLEQERGRAAHDRP